MALLNRYLMPHGGFPYTELLPGNRKWKPANPFLPFDMIAEQIQAVRVANPLAGLNPAFDACKADLDLFTCKRLKYHPKWCSPEGSPAAQAAQAAAPSTRTAVRRCGGCGARKAAKAKLAPKRP